NRKLYFLSHNTFPKLQVLKALKMSSAIPICFSPVIHDDKMFIDGGCINNYPINYFNNELDSVLGIQIVHSCNENVQINNFEEYLTGIFGCFIASNDHFEYNNYTIKINLPDINIANFNVSKND